MLNEERFPDGLSMRENNSLKSSNYPNLIAPIRKGLWEFSFTSEGLEIWPSDGLPLTENFFEIMTPGLYGVYGTDAKNMVVMPLDK